MKNNTLEAYKSAIRDQYEIQKNGDHATFLLEPSRAKLRKLCFELFNDDPSQNDLNVFAAFCGFDFEKTSSNRLKVLTDKFRPLETFLKGETDLADLNAVNMVAILINFQPRPYAKFCKSDSEVVDEIGHSVKEETLIVSVNTTNAVENLNLEGKVKPTFYKQIVLAVLVTSILCGLGFVFLSKKQCMQWQGDHYEKVDCEENASLGFVNLYSKVPLKEDLYKLKKITVCDTTTFFIDHKAVVWYCKKGNVVEFFNGAGFHPENDKPLRPITQYMIDKYVK